jgi:DNA-binding response OmpR family regulator
MTNRILLIDDNPDLVPLLKSVSDDIAAGFDREAEPLDGLRRAAARWYPLVVVDVRPVMKGFEVCRSLRRDFPSVRLLLCTARNDEFERVLGLEFGADDAISRPFEPREVLARARALLRRAVLPTLPDPEGDIDRLRVGRLEVDLRLRRVARGLAGAPVPLSAVEVTILRELASRPGRGCTREELMRALWGGSPRSLDCRLASRMSRLRAKLEAAPGQPSLIQTVPGMGYRIVEQSEAAG